jgi:hypothetical protein
MLGGQHIAMKSLAEDDTPLLIRILLNVGSLRNGLKPRSDCEATLEKEKMQSEVDIRVGASWGFEE